MSSDPQQPPSGAPSYEELAGLVVVLQGQMAELCQELAASQQRVAELEAQLAKNSQNSSKPRSSDGLSKPPPKPASPRQRGKRSAGGQPGHEGLTLQQVADPDEVVEHSPVQCAGCDRDLGAGDAVVQVTARQVFEIPHWRRR